MRRQFWESRGCEGAGLFNLAKLSSEEMGRAKLDAEIIMGKIERNIKARQATQQTRQ